MNLMSKTYDSYANKEFLLETFSDMGIAYRIYCSSIYNAIRAIQEVKEIFENTSDYTLLSEITQQIYCSDDARYYTKAEYKASLYKILKTVRDQLNHSLNGETDDNIVLFEAYIDIGILNRLRDVINSVFSEIYKQIDKTKLKQIVLSKSRVKYSLDKVYNKAEELKLNISNQNLPGELNKYNNQSLKLYDELFSPDSLFDLLSGDPVMLEKFDLADKEMNLIFKNTEKWIAEYGSECDQELLRVFKEFIEDDSQMSVGDIDTRLTNLRDKFKNVCIKYGVDIPIEYK